MASSQRFLDHVQDLLSAEGMAVTARKMFGEYAIYLDGRVVALVCDDQLFIKSLPATANLTTGMKAAPPYPGARDHWLADDELDEPARLAQILAATAMALPLPVPRKSKASAKTTSVKS